MSLPKAKRTRHGTGAIDVDSEDEFDIDTTAVFDTTSGNITLEPRLYASKRSKLDHSQPTVAVSDNAEARLSNSTSSKPKVAGEMPEMNTKKKQVCLVVSSDTRYFTDQI